MQIGEFLTTKNTKGTNSLSALVKRKDSSSFYLCPFVFFVLFVVKNSPYLDRLLV